MSKIEEWYPEVEGCGTDGGFSRALATRCRPAVVAEYEKTINAVFVAGAEVSSINYKRPLQAWSFALPLALLSSQIVLHPGVTPPNSRDVRRIFLMSCSCRLWAVLQDWTDPGFLTRFCWDPVSCFSFIALVWMEWSKFRGPNFNLIQFAGTKAKTWWSCQGSWRCISTLAALLPWSRSDARRWHHIHCYAETLIEDYRAADVWPFAPFSTGRGVFHLWISFFVCMCCLN